MLYIVGFNGPPRCGKDTMAKMLAEHMDEQGVSLPVIPMSLSYPLRKVAGALTNQMDAITGYQGELYEDFKTQRFPFGPLGTTGRQLMIDVSERFLKPCYGQEIMAQLLIQSLPDFPAVILIPDCGFQAEISPLVRQVGYGNLYVARVWRDGCSFKDDSREWVSHTYMGDYPNDGTLDDLRTEAGRLYGRLVNQMGWKL